MSTPTEPQVVLGLTVPAHVVVNADVEDETAYVLECSKHENWPYAVIEQGEDAVERVTLFLCDHAHGGEVVEYRPEPREGVAEASKVATRNRVTRALENAEEIEAPGLGIVALDEEPVPVPSVAPSREPGCCTACHGEGGVRGEPCSDCLTTGHAHDGPCPVKYRPARDVATVSEPGSGRDDAEDIERLRYVLAASDGAGEEWHKLATAGVTAAAKWKARFDAAEAKLDAVRAFADERAGFITAITNCHPDNVSDYHRWQGHAESRRQLSERLGLPTAWPAKEATQ